MAARRQSRDGKSDEERVKALAVRVRAAEGRGELLRKIPEECFGAKLGRCYEARINLSNPHQYGKDYTFTKESDDMYRNFWYDVDKYPKPRDGEPVILSSSPLVEERGQPVLQLLPKPQQQYEYKVEQGHIIASRSDAAQKLEDILNQFASKGYRLKLGEAFNRDKSWHYLTVFEREVSPLRTSDIVGDTHTNFDEQQEELNNEVRDAVIQGAVAAMVGG